MIIAIITVTIICMVLGLTLAFLRGASGDFSQCFECGKLFRGSDWLCPTCKDKVLNDEI